MVDNGGEGMVAFLGVAADPRLLDEDLINLPDAEQHHEPAISTHKHDRLVTAGSVLTRTTLVGGAAMTLYGGRPAPFPSGGAFPVVPAPVGPLLGTNQLGRGPRAAAGGPAIAAHQGRAGDPRT